MDPVTSISSQFSNAGEALAWLTWPRIVGILFGVLTVCASVPVARIIRAGVIRSLGGRWSVQQKAIAKRATSYIIYSVAMLIALSFAGVDGKSLIASAGLGLFVVTYASQKSLSQIITGLFIVIEQPFVLGDTITISGITGEVISIDLLSIKLRTADNLFVRVPSEMLLSGPVTNASHYTIRRLDIDLGVSYREDISLVSRVLYEVSDKNPLVLEEPRPLFIFSGYGDSALKMQFCVWGRKESFLDMKNSMYEGIKKAFDAQGIEMPYPHRALVAGAGKESISITLTPEAATATAGDRAKKMSEG